MMSEGIIAQDFLEIVIVGERVWSRPNKGHLSAKHIDELRQFVDAGRTQQPADGSYARVIPCSLNHRRPVLQHAHGSKLEHQELFAVKAFARLPEYYRTRTIELDGNRG